MVYLGVEERNPAWGHNYFLGVGFVDAAAVLRELELQEAGEGDEDLVQEALDGAVDILEVLGGVEHYDLRSAALSVAG